MSKWLLVLIALLPSPCLADVFGISGGVNTVSFDSTFPSDFELAGTMRASLSPHISGVGGLYWGFGRSYVRSTIGARVTATDANNPYFSVGFGAEYQSCSEPEVRAEEWLATANIGYVPWPATLPRLSIGAQAAYGFDSSSGMLLLAGRWAITSF